jgi:hypothetical protein
MRRTDYQPSPARYQVGVPIQAAPFFLPFSGAAFCCAFLNCSFGKMTHVRKINAGEKEKRKKAEKLAEKIK